jgi:hypothetical protein
VNFPCMGLACLNFTRVRAELKDEPNNQARIHNKSSQAEPVHELALIFYFIYLFIINLNFKYS